MDASISEEENLFYNDDDVQENDEISKLLAENQSSRHKAWRKKITATLALICVPFWKDQRVNGDANFPDASLA